MTTVYLISSKQNTMKVLVITLAVAAILVAAEDDGQYRSESNRYASGSYGGSSSDDSGRYVHDNSGAYVDDRSGEYYHDGTGYYSNDGSGIYGPDGSGAYRGGGGQYHGGAGESGGSRGGLFGSRQVSVGILGSNLLGAGTFQNKQTIKAQSFGESSSATTNYAQTGSLKTGHYDDGRWKIIRQAGDVDTDGYHWEYETENKINAAESGKLANKGTDAEAIRAQGFFEYTGPDNVRYAITYTADENGFVPQGAHIPTPPPIPEAILKSLQYQRAAGELHK